MARALPAVTALRGLVFDFDGVVLRSVDLKTRAFEALFSSEKPEHVRRIVEYYKVSGGLPRLEKLRWVYREVLRRPLTAELEAELGRRYNALVEDAVVACEFVAGAREFLERQPRGLPLYVASGTPEEELRRIVQRRGLSACFAGVFGAPREKSAILTVVAAGLACAAHELVMVGDSMHDLASAKAAGTRFIGVGAAGVFPPGTRVIADLRGLEEALGA